MEGRGLAKGNSPWHNALRTQGRAGASKGLERVREVAARDKKVRFTALLHHIYDRERLKAAYYALKRDRPRAWTGRRGGTTGRPLSDRLKRGAYRAEPVKRAYIAKTDGRQRPLGIPTLKAFEPEARAQCGKSARWDPRRGRRATGVPTPTRPEGVSRPQGATATDSGILRGGLGNPRQGGAFQEASKRRLQTPLLLTNEVSAWC
jgi:hypothetical protein